MAGSNEREPTLVTYSRTTAHRQSRPVPLRGVSSARPAAPSERPNVGQATKGLAWPTPGRGPTPRKGATHHRTSRRSRCSCHQMLGAGRSKLLWPTDRAERGARALQTTMGPRLRTVGTVQHLATRLRVPRQAAARQAKTTTRLTRAAGRAIPLEKILPMTLILPDRQLTAHRQSRPPSTRYESALTPDR